MQEQGAGLPDWTSAADDDFFVCESRVAHDDLVRAGTL